MTDLAGRQLGEFTLLDRIGAGGMGVVYRAHQSRLDRPAVVKVLYRMAPDPIATRDGFLREARLASRVDHPFAAHVYAFGCEPDGTLWISMERVNGVSLADWIHKHKHMSLEQFVPFFERVCRVVQHAHERNILHRDLKPANIMVCEDGSELYPKLLDFGLAKLLDGATQPGLRQLPDCSSDSSSNSTFLGTPYYAAPEMWTVPASAGPASDLYALGVVAFEMLTGVRPFEGDSAQAVGVEHMSGRYAAPPAGLESVFKRALARYPEDRYTDALELAEAFRIEADARLAGQIRTSARQWIASGRSVSLLWRGDMLARMEEWSRRTSQADAKLSRTSSEFIEASRDEHLAEMQRERRRARRERNISLGAIALIVIGGLYIRAERADRRADAAEQVTAATALTAEVEQGRAALLHDDLPEAQRHLGAAADMGDRSAATRFMLARALTPLRAELARLPALSGRMWSASWSPDGTMVATGDDRGAQVWSATTYQQLFEIPVGETVYDVRWSGDRLLTASGDGSVRVWNGRTGSLAHELRLHGRAPRWRYAVAAGSVVAAVDTLGAVAAVWSGAGDPATLDLDGSEWPVIAVSPDGRWLAAGGGSSVTVMELASGRRIQIPGPGIRSIAWGPTGLLTGSTSGEASIWSADGMRVHRLREVGEPVDVVAWSPDGRAAVAARDGSVQVFNSEGAPISRGNEIHGKITAMDFTTSGIAVAGARGEVAVLDPATGMLVAQLGGQAGPVKAVRLSGTSVLAASWDGTARIWDARSPYRQWASEPEAENCGMVGGGTPDGPVFVVGCPGHPTRVWGADRMLAELPPLDRVVPAPYPVAAEDRVAIARGTSAELYDTSGRLIFAVEHAVQVTAVAILNGELASGDSGGVVMIDGRVESEGAPVDAIAVAAGRILIADAKGLRGVVALPVRARMLRVSSDGSRVLAVPNYAGAAGSPILVDLAGRAVIARLDGPQVYGVRWTPSGILTGHADGAARLWSTDGKLTRTYRGARRFVADADITPDGSMVVGGSGDGVLHFWDAATGRPLWSMAAHQQQLLGLHALQDGSIITRGTGAEVSHWRIPENGGP